MSNKIRNMQEWKESLCDDRLKEWEKVISHFVLKSKGKRFAFPGKCIVCGTETDFLLDDMYSESDCLNFRERLVCPNCGLNNRQRALFGLLEEMNEYRSFDIYMYEQVTASYVVMKRRCKSLIGSEYFGCDYSPGHIMDNGMRHEDAMNLSFENESFDLIISQDVYEHVSDIKIALQEAWRVLRFGGNLIISVPFHTNKINSIQRAFIKDKKIVYQLPPAYHGNPIDPSKGSLVFWDYGWDFLDFLQQAGFKDAYIRKYYSPWNGNVGVDSIFFIVAEKREIGKEKREILQHKIMSFFRETFDFKWEFLHGQKNAMGRKL